MRQLTLAVRELHQLNIVHLNLHPSTIYIGRDNNLKITDFAHSKDIKDSDNQQANITKMKSIDYVAPEILDHKTPTLAADVYSLGLIFAFIKYGKIDNL
jgi:3-phosphoinositide dependent protein kinase-1